MVAKPIGKCATITLFNNNIGSWKKKKTGEREKRNESKGGEDNACIYYVKSIIELNVLRSRMFLCTYLL